MSQFISLREFLSYPDPIDKHGNTIHSSGTRIHARVEYWLLRYDIAKASFDQYGAEGPPIGSVVYTLVPGHGGNGGDRRILTGVYANDNRFFTLGFDPYSSLHSLVARDHWWSDIADETIWKKYERDFCRSRNVR